MNNENLEKDLERVGSFSVSPLSFGDRLLRGLGRAERIAVKVGKVGLVLTVLITAAVAFGNREEADDLNRQVDFLSKVATSPDRSWVARELVVGNSTPCQKRCPPAFAVPTGKFVCGKAGQVPRECTPEPYVARTTELCVFPWTADGWPKTWRPVGVAPGKFGTPRLCPDSILHPEK